MSESTDISLLVIKPEQAPEIYITDGLEKYLEIIEKQVSEVPDLSTARGRARVASLAAQVSRSKTAIEKPGREYLKRLKEAVKPAEVELRRFADKCDALRDKTRLPLTEWEAEQERIKAEEKFNADHAEAIEMNNEHDRLAAERDRLAAERFESDFEIALLLNEKFDREAADAAAEAERQRIAYEQELQRKAAEKAKQEAEAAAQRERDEAAQREAKLIADAEHARLSREAEKQWEERKSKEAQEQAEREKQEAIEAERRKAQQAEQARLAEEKRAADEAAKKAADKAHQASVDNAAIEVLTSAGISAECAKSAVIAIINNQKLAAASGQRPALQVNY